MKRFKRTSYLKDIRLALGLTQFEMIAYLGVTPSGYSMAEGEQRELPSLAGLQLAYLQLSMMAKPTTKVKLTLTEKDKNQENALKKWAKNKLTDCEIELFYANEKLEKLQMKAGQATLLLQTAIHRANNPYKEDNAWTKNGLELFKASASDKLWKYGNTEQSKLLFRITILKKEIEELKLLI